jgi:mono/diheme cytochrome c family protein
MPTLDFAINPNAPRPSNMGGPGQAIFLTGDPVKGAEIFAANCVACHGVEGKGGVANPGSTEGVVPTLNPMEDKIKDEDERAYAYNLALFIQNGSTPKGSSPTFSMPAWGVLESLSQQQIADVIAYLIKLNP